MQLRALITAGLVALGVTAAHAQSVSPMRNEGTTPSDIKGFRVTVGNPYPVRMAFSLVPMEPGFTVLADNTQVVPAELVLAPNQSRTVIFAFKIAAPHKEREVALCVTPKKVTGPVVTRVCGTYTGSVLRR